METMMEDVRATAERLNAAAEEAQREAETAGAALTLAEAAVAEITSRVKKHDGSSPGIERLAAERGIAVARVEALTARLSDKMTALATAKTAAADAGTALDASDFAAGLAELDAAGVKFDEQLSAAATALATTYVEHAKLHDQVARLNARVQLTRGTRPDDIRWIQPLRQPGELGEAFGRCLDAAITSALGR